MKTIEVKPLKINNEDEEEWKEIKTFSPKTKLRNINSSLIPQFF